MTKPRENQKHLHRLSPKQLQALFAGQNGSGTPWAGLVAQGGGQLLIENSNFARVPGQPRHLQYNVLADGTVLGPIEIFD